ncbi:hypothetical protein CL622_01920, partial [archaeon]|nr:hypothetical protein [archaeon]
DSIPKISKLIEGIDMISEGDLAEVVQVLRNLANDLEDCGPDEWESLEDCVRATKANFEEDCKDIGKGR